MAPQGPSEIAETLGLIGKTHMEETNAQTLIKPVDYEDFWGSFRKMDRKCIKNPLRFLRQVDGV